MKLRYALNRVTINERLSSSALAVLKDMDRFGQLASLPGQRSLRRMRASGSGPNTHTISLSGAAMTCRFMLCRWCLPE